VYAQMVQSYSEDFWMPQCWMHDNL
jgi:hypothetical protein